MVKKQKMKFVSYHPCLISHCNYWREMEYHYLRREPF